jgi:WD40 repeat protein/tetratricopeptide (TPR) repeat protein
LIAQCGSAVGHERPPEFEEQYQRGLALYQAGKYAEAIPIAQQYIEAAAARYGEQHPWYASGLGYLAILYQALDRLAEAEPLFKRALAIKETALGPDDVEVADALHNVAELYRKQGKLSDAEPLYRRALNIAEKKLGSDHPAVGTVRNDLAELYRAQGRHADADRLLKGSVDIGEKTRLATQPIVGSEAEDPADMLSRAMELYRAGKYAEAIPIAERYAQIIEARYGKEGPEYGLALNNVGELYRLTNRLSEAEPLLRRALAIDEKALGLDHPNVGMRLNNLANLLQNTNRLAEAEPLYRRALTIYEKSAGVDDPNVGMVLTGLAQLLNTTNRVAEAESLFKRVAAINEKALRRGAIAQGKVQLGVLMNDLTKEEAEKLGLPLGRGVRVIRVVDGSPAEVAGLLPNDILLSLDGSDITGAKETIAALQSREAGTQILLRILRGGIEQTMVALLGNVVRPAQEGSPQLMLDTGGHTALIKGLIFTPDGKQLVSAGDDKVIRVWDKETGSIVRTIRGQVGPGPEGRIYALALSPEGRWLATGGWMAPGRGVRDKEIGDIRLYDFATGNLVALLRGHTDGVNSLAFSADGKLLISGSGDGTAILWDVANRRLVHRLWGHRQFVYATSFTRDGMRAVTGSDDGTLKLWSVNDGKEITTLTGHKGRVFRLAISAADGTIASGSYDGEIRLWDDKTGQFRRTLANVGRVGALTFSPDGKRLLACSAAVPDHCHVWELATGNEIVTYTKHDNIVIAAAVSADGRLAATAGGNQAQIHIWSLETGETKQTLVGRGRQHWAVGLSTDGRRIAWGTTPNFRGYNERGPLDIQLRLPAGTQGLGWPEKASQAAEMNWFRGRIKYGTMELTHRAGGTFGYESSILDVKKDGQTQASIERGTLDGYYHISYSFSPDGRTIISGSSNGVLTAFDLIGRRLGEFVGHEGDVWALAPSPDGRTLVSGSADQTVRVWNLATRELIVTLFNGSDGAWVMWTPQGYYTGSPGAEGIVGWQINKGPDQAAEYVSAAQLRGHFFRPDIVERALILGERHGGSGAGSQDGFFYCRSAQAQATGVRYHFACRQEPRQRSLRRGEIEA